MAMENPDGDGPTMTMAPQKPIKAATSRRAPGFSPSSKAAPITTKIGDMNAIAVTSASGPMPKAAKKATMANSLNSARTACWPSEWVEASTPGRRARKGSSRTTPNRARKNAITKGCTAPSRARTMTASDAASTAAPTANRIAAVTRSPFSPVCMSSSQSDLHVGMGKTSNFLQTLSNDFLM